MHAKASPRARLSHARPPANGNGMESPPTSTSTRLLPICAKIDLAVSREIDDYAS